MFYLEIKAVQSGLPEYGCKRAGGYFFSWTGDNDNLRASPEFPVAS
jgi:hypothetical protein